jgi:hypothetical protein
MMKKVIYAFLIFTVLGKFAVAQDKVAGTAIDAGKAEMTFTEEEFNFGTIKQNDIVNHEFVFTNSGKEPLVITEAHGSCGCTVPQWPKEPIKKGEKGTIKVTFNSAGKMGMQDKTVTITSNAASSPKVLHLKGTVLSKEEAESNTPFKKDNSLSPIEK